MTQRRPKLALLRPRHDRIRLMSLVVLPPRPETP
jgi:hypothetical protein